MLENNNISQSVTKATVIIILLAMIGRLLGFVKEAVIAAKFGTNVLTDAYVTAQTFPDILSIIVNSGVIGLVLIPTLIQLRINNDEKECWYVANSFFNLIFIISIIVCVIGIIGADYIVLCLAPGLSLEGKELAVKLTRVIAPCIIFLTGAGFCGAVLNSYKHFTIPSLGPILLNVIIILVIILLGEKISVLAIVIGFLLGSIVQFIIQFPMLFRVGFCYKLYFFKLSPQVKRVILSGVPIIGVTLLIYSRHLIERIMASTLSDGSIAIMNFANKLMLLPVSILPMAIVTVIFPKLSEEAAVEDINKYTQTISLSIRMMSLIIIPFAVILISMSLPLVKILFERGAFTSESSEITANVLMWLAVGIFSLSVNELFIRAFFALGNTFIPLITATISIIITVITNIILINWLGISGLAIGTSIGLIANTIMLSERLYRKLPLLDIANITFSIFKMLSCGLVTGLIIHFVFYNFSLLLSLNIFSQLSCFLIIFIIEIIIYLLGLKFLNVPEVTYLYQRFIEKFRSEPPHSYG